MENKKFIELKVSDKIYYTIYGTPREGKILSISHNRNTNSKIFYTKDGSFEIEKEFLNNDFYNKILSIGLETAIATSMDRLLLECE